LGKKRKQQGASQKKKSSPETTTVKEKPAALKKKKKRPVLQKREHPNLLVTGLAGAGMLLTAYLVITSWIGQPPLYCDQGSTCDIVQQSRWGTFLGMPVSLFGFLTYASLAYIGFRVRDPGQHWKSSWTVSLVGLSYSIYLNAISLLVIEAACAYCLASLSIMTVIFGVIIFQRPAGLADFKFTPWAGQTIVVAMVIVGGMHLHYSGVFNPSSGPEDPYLQGLAEHLSKENAVIYGAFW
jgi:uncharacterized membrane protein